MEAATASSSAAIAGPSSEATTPAAFDDDNARHYAITACQLPKPASTATTSFTLPPPAPTPAAPSSSTSMADTGIMKEGKSVGTRFHEDCHETDLPTSPRLRSSRVTLYKGKGKEAVTSAVEKEKEKERKTPLRLLDLPVDILKDIVKEVTHTNDLTSLALCHSALHGLAIPHIYSRFDIVWPDTSVHSEPRSGVDALTYGLATLVMAEEIFGEAPWQRRETERGAAGGNRFLECGKGRASDMAVRRRRGNHYAQFTKKFSLGNGPADWVQEYLITKEGGKMLGTLVALAVARMRLLETFIWDMPTGILRDVWLALSSLGDREDERECRLEKVWVRWHDNSSADASQLVPPPPPPLGLHHAAVPAPLQHTSSTGSAGLPPQFHPAALDRVEHPSFSVLPPLKSLSVLDIDELAYLDEMAVLIGRSLDKLRELRIGIARHAMSRDWVTVWEGDNLQQVDPHHPTAGSLTIGEKRLGGALGVVTGFVCDMRRPRVVLPDRTKRRAVANPATPASAAVVETPLPPTPVEREVEIDPIAEALDAVTGTSLSAIPDLVPSGQLPIAPSPSHSSWISPESTLGPEAAYSDSDPLIATSRQASPTSERHEVIAESPPVAAADRESVAASSLSPESYETMEPDREYLNNVLSLESLELERVPLAIPVLQRAIDWTKLTSLTLLHCQNHEQLWKTLRRNFAPLPKSPAYPAARRTPSSTPRKSPGKASINLPDVEMDYCLSLKKIHTNTVSPALISFLKETLAPNSLEVLFLQEARSYTSSVAVDAIFRGPIRRHRGSLRKVLIDSSEKGADGLPTNSSRWRRWIVSREILAFMCSGKMPQLRELGVALDYRDWHFFLQHIPSIPDLRSLYIPFLADHVHGTNVDPRELALQIVDIVALRPEVELCYMGIANKCFEILENKRNDFDPARDASHLGLSGTIIEEDAGGSDADEDDEAEEVEEEEDEEEVEEAEDETESDEDVEDDDSDSEVFDGERHAARLRLREILFYDDKVAVFKARHGRL